MSTPATSRPTPIRNAVYPFSALVSQVPMKRALNLAAIQSGLGGVLVQRSKGAATSAAAMGVNHVEREGVTFRHPSRFVLVGTMNPEEGDLRPQLLDRFGLAVEVEPMTDPADRAEVVRRRLAFETDPAGFLARWRDDD